MRSALANGLTAATQQAQFNPITQEFVGELRRKGVADSYIAQHPWPARRYLTRIAQRHSVQEGRRHLLRLIRAARCRLFFRSARYGPAPPLRSCRRSRNPSSSRILRDVSRSPAIWTTRPREGRTSTERYGLAQGWRYTHPRQFQPALHLHIAQNRIRWSRSGDTERSASRPALSKMLRRRTRLA